MKKYIPFFIAIVLIVVVIYFSFGKQIKDTYTYSQEKADLYEYFGTFSSAEIPIMLQDELIGEYGKMIDGALYLSKNTVSRCLTDRFYVDTNEKLLLYTNATGTVVNEIGSNTYTINDETSSMQAPVSVETKGEIYILLDYVKKYVNFSYEVFENPAHMQLTTEWNQRTVADISESTSVRLNAGTQSPILIDAEAGESVVLLEEVDDWTKVKTKESYIGYVETKYLSNEITTQETPVMDVPPEKFISLTKDCKINLVWHNMEYSKSATELYQACAKVESVNVISPTWFWLSDNEGGIKSIATTEYVEAAHKMDMEVWALVANFHSGTDVDLNEVITYTSKRKRIIDSLVQETLSVGAEGINLDFESVPSSVGDSYIQFVRELSVACHENGLILSVDNYVPTEYTSFYNRKEQGIFADYVIIMGYDEHYAGGSVGSVSGIQWMSEGIKNTLADVPASKVINAIPFYTRVWKTTGGDVKSEAVVMSVANEFISKNKANLEIGYDDATGQTYAEGTIGGTLYQVWMEDAESVGARLNVISTYGIAGVAEWCLGQETSDIWQVIEAYMNY